MTTIQLDDVTIELGERNGRIGVVGVRSRDGHLTTAALRHLPLNRIVREHTSPPRTTAVAITYEAGARGRPRLSDETLAQVAEVYREARARRRRTDDAVAEVFGIKRTTARKWVFKARQRGLLA